MSHHLDRLTCEEVFRRLDDFLDRELSAEDMQLVREHLDTCEICTQEFQFEAGVIEGIRAKLQRIVLPVDLVARITRRIDEERRSTG